MPACGYVFYLALVRYQIEHEKIKFISTCGHVISSIYYSILKLRYSPSLFKSQEKLNKMCIVKQPPKKPQQKSQ